jgi:hypothetical protein
VRSGFLMGPRRFPGDDRVQWGVCVAAPAQYDARDFLLHLFGQLCAAVLGPIRVQILEAEMTGLFPGGGPVFDFPFWWLAVYASLTGLLCGAAVAGLDSARPVGSGWPLTDLLIAGCCAALAVSTVAVSDRPVRAWAQRAVPDTRLMDLVEARDVSEAVGREYEAFKRRRVRVVRLGWVAVILASAALAGALSGLVASGGSVNPAYLIAGVISVVAAVIFCSVRSRLWFAGIVRAKQFRPNPPVAAAEQWYRKVKFQQSFTTGWSGAVTLAPPALPVQAQAGWSGSKAVTPIAMSIPEIVSAFRLFTEVLRTPLRPETSAAFDFSGGTAAELRTRPPDEPPAPPVPVVIGIDEVDKIEDPGTAQAFFNQIKGLFGDTNCLFLISVSDDAMAAYERRGLPLRDAFDSSLATVITLSYLARREARTLAGSCLVRITEPAADLMYVLSGGLPRELVRLIRRAVEIQRDRAGEEETRRDRAGEENAGREAWRTPPVPLDDFAVTLIADQVTAQRRAVLIRGRVLEPCAARDGLLAWAGDPASGAAVGDSEPAGAGYFDELIATGTRLMAACDGSVADPLQGPGGVRPHADGCTAEETGAYLLWLGTIGQVFLACQEPSDFEVAERPHEPRSFERLARARQNFPLGPGYVQAAVTDVRMAWGLAPPQEERRAR